MVYEDFNKERFQPVYGSDTFTALYISILDSIGNWIKQQNINDYERI